MAENQIIAAVARHATRKLNESVRVVLAATRLGSKSNFLTEMKPSQNQWGMRLATTSRESGSRLAVASKNDFGDSLNSGA